MAGENDELFITAGFDATALVEGIKLAATTVQEGTEQISKAFTEASTASVGMVERLTVGSDQAASAITALSQIQEGARAAAINLGAAEQTLADAKLRVQSASNIVTEAQKNESADYLTLLPLVQELAAAEQAQAIAEQALADARNAATVSLGTLEAGNRAAVTALQQLTLAQKENQDQLAAGADRITASGLAAIQLASELRLLGEASEQAAGTFAGLGASIASAISEATAITQAGAVQITTAFEQIGNATDGVAGKINGVAFDASSSVAALSDAEAAAAAMANVLAESEQKLAQSKQAVIAATDLLKIAEQGEFASYNDLVALSASVVAAQQSQAQAERELALVRQGASLTLDNLNAKMLQTSEALNTLSLSEKQAQTEAAENVAWAQGARQLELLGTSAVDAAQMLQGAAAPMLEIDAAVAKWATTFGQALAPIDAATASLTKLTTAAQVSEQQLNLFGVNIVDVATQITNAAGQLELFAVPLSSVNGQLNLFDIMSGSATAQADLFTQAQLNAATAARANTAAMIELIEAQTGVTISGAEATNVGYKFAEATAARVAAQGAAAVSTEDEAAALIELVAAETGVTLSKEQAVAVTEEYANVAASAAAVEAASITGKTIATTAQGGLNISLAEGITLRRGAASALDFLNSKESLSLATSRQVKEAWDQLNKELARLDLELTATAGGFEIVKVAEDGVAVSTRNVNDALGYIGARLVATELGAGKVAHAFGLLARAIPALSTALSVAFAPIIIFTFADIVESLIERFGRVESAIRKAGVALDALTTSITEMGNEIELSTLKLEDQISKLTGGTGNENKLQEQLLEARIEADKLTKALENAIERQTDLFKSNEIGAFRGLFIGQESTTGFLDKIRDANEQIIAGMEKQQAANADLTAAEFALSQAKKDGNKEEQDKAQAAITAATQSKTHADEEVARARKKALDIVAATQTEIDAKKKAAQEIKTETITIGGQAVSYQVGGLTEEQAAHTVAAIQRQVTAERQAIVASENAEEAERKRAKERERLGKLETDKPTKDNLSEFQKLLDEKNLSLDAFHRVSVQGEIDFWTQVGNTQKLSKNQQMELEHKLAELQKKLAHETLEQLHTNNIEGTASFKRASEERIKALKAERDQMQRLLDNPPGAKPIVIPPTEVKTPAAPASALPAEIQTPNVPSSIPAPDVKTETTAPAGIKPISYEATTSPAPIPPPTTPPTAPSAAPVTPVAPSAPLAPVLPATPPSEPFEMGKYYAQKYGVDDRVVERMMNRESGGDQSQVSPKGAIGAMQLMPGTAKDLGVDPHNMQENIEGGVRHLHDLLVKFDNDYTKAVAAYHAGAGAVQKAGGVPDTSDGISTTADYVKGILGGVNKPGQGKTPTPSLPKEGSQLDLKVEVDPLLATKLAATKAEITRSQEALDEQNAKDAVRQEEIKFIAAQKGSSERVQIAEREVKILSDAGYTNTQTYLAADRRLTEAKRENANQREQIGKEETRHDEQMALTSVEEHKRSYDARLTDLQKNSSQAIAQEQKFADQIYQIHKTALENDLRLAKENPNTSPEARRRLEDQIIELERKHAAEKKAIDDKGLQDRIALENNISRTLETAYANMFVSMFKSAKDFQQALVQLWNGILQDFAQFLAKKLQRWIEHNILMKIWEKIFGKDKGGTEDEKKETARSTAHVAANAVIVTSDAATAAAQVADAASVAAANDAAALNQGLTNELLAASAAALAGANTLAYTSAYEPPPVPEAEAAATYADGMAYAGLAAFDYGGIMPETDIALVHQGEGVLTAPTTQMLQTVNNAVNNGAFSSTTDMSSAFSSSNTNNLARGGSLALSADSFNGTLTAQNPSLGLGSIETHGGKGGDTTINQGHEFNFHIEGGKHDPEAIANQVMAKVKRFYRSSGVMK